MSSPPTLPIDRRATQLLAWLASQPARHRLDLDSVETVRTDAGTRRYFRIASAGLHGPTLIAVDAPPPEKCRAFRHVAQLLLEAGIHAPRVLEADFECGFMLVTDLGRATYLDQLDPTDPDAAQPLFMDALNTLINWQCATCSGALPDYDEALLRRELELFPQWYLQRHLGLMLTPTLRAALDTAADLLIRNALAQPRVFTHRDYMPRNLIISTPNPGVLDFQDAVMGPPTYDLVSLFRDAFISWTEDFERDCIAHYYTHARNKGLPVRADFEQFYREFEWMGLQRHLKNLGLFARLHYRDGKSHYLADTPRFIAYAQRTAQRYPELAPLAHVLTLCKPLASRTLTALASTQNAMMCEGIEAVQIVEAHG